MKIFRNLGDPPPVDMGRLTRNLARVAELDAELDRVVARLAVDMPGNADAVAAAGIHMRAQVNRSSSMIELGAAAVDALRRGGWTLREPVTELVASIEQENERIRAGVEARRPRPDQQLPPGDDIPDDWAQ